MTYVKTIEEQLWSRTKKDPDTGCVEWLGPVNSTGYGWITRGGKTRGAHVWAFESVHGPVPEGKIVCHRCDNPRCCNPDHHYAGDPTSNARDMHGRNRHPRTNGWTAATPEERRARSAAISAKQKGREKTAAMRSRLSETAKGRVRVTLPTGKTTWFYPLKRSA
jgi:hypothetical protein